MIEYKTFMSVTDLATSEEIVQILDAQKIPFKVQDTSKDFDPTFSNNEADNSILIMLFPTDFEKATKILDENLVLDLNKIDPEHPFFSFATDELKEVVKNYDEWHPLDVKLAKYLLKDKNISIDNIEIERVQKHKKQKELEPEKPKPLTLVMGYVFCLLGGLIGIGIAVFLITGKKSLPDGSKRFVYSPQDRAHGVFMLIAGILSFFFYIYYFKL